MISIIVPVYNAGLYLERCLNSLLQQTYRNIEVICIDDGSQDDSNSILNKYSQKDLRIKVITQENNGIASARNRGLEEAKGEWIMFVDSDDWIDITTCEKAIETALSKNVDVVFWAYIREFTDGRKSPRFLMEEDKLFDEKNIRSLHRKIVGPLGPELRDPTLLHSWGTVWGKLYLRKVISKIRFTDTKVVGSAEDVLFNMEVFADVKRAYYINEPMYHYQKNAKSFTGGYNEYLNERWLNLYAMMSDIIIKHSLLCDFVEALNNRILLGIIGQGINECKSSHNIRGKINTIKQLITQQHYRQAVQNLRLNYFPFHWRLFFQAAKNGNATILYLLLLIIYSRT
ncbi:glycosyltransferase family 2 protein [Prevotella sp. 10(H)]|uniref:glycosyltransferase family 2 protein n=1 Tax=Prevotella sp. 10(H) TaxID=1158294 RepID=UPI0004A74B73|nr:glycosyltransferase family 2 protein [Prevotella sp. 10(H)]